MRLAGNGVEKYRDFRADKGWHSSGFELKLG